MKISSLSSQINIQTIKAEAILSPVPGLFKTVIERFVSIEKAVNSAIPKMPVELKSLVELQRSCSALQLQVECASRVADSATSTIKKIHQLGGQG